MTPKTRPVRRTVCTRSSASSMVVVIGLSQITSIPRSRKARAMAWWLSFGVTMLTTSMLSGRPASAAAIWAKLVRSEEHTSELQSQSNLVCRLLLEKKKKQKNTQEIEQLNPTDTDR